MTGNDMKKYPDLAVLYECADIFAGYSDVRRVAGATVDAGTRRGEDA